MKNAHAMAAPKFFNQVHPVRNLGKFAHPPAQSAHREKKAPALPQADRHSFNGSPDYRPSGTPKQNKRFDIATPANQQSMDASDNKSESYPGGFGADNAATSRVSGGKPVKRKLKSGLDLFGKL